MRAISPLCSANRSYTVSYTHLQHIAHLAADGLFVQLFQTQTKGHVLEHIQVREQLSLIHILGTFSAEE